MTRPRILVPPMSRPATTPGRGRGRRGRSPRSPSVAQQGADATHHVEIGVVDAHLDVARLVQGGLDRLSSTMSSTGDELLTAPRARAPMSPRCPQPSQRHPGSAVVGRHQQLRRRGDRRRPASTGPRPATARLPVATWLRRRATASASRRRSTSRSTSRAASRISAMVAADPDVDAPAQPLAQVRVEHRLDRTGDGPGCADGEVLEGLVLEDLEGHVGGVAQMGGGQGLDVAPHVALVGVAPGVVVAGQLVEQIGVVDQLTEAGTRACEPAACRPAARRSGRTPGPATRAGTPPDPG